MTWRVEPARPYPEGLPTLKPEDYQYFAPLLKETEDEELSLEEQKERKIMKMLLKAGWLLRTSTRPMLYRQTESVRLYWGY